MTDEYRDNDLVHTDGLFKKRRKPRLTFAWTLPKDDRATLFWTPVLAGNAYNKFMLGAAFYNSLVFEKKWQYMLMPLYSFKQQNLNGSFSLFRNFYGKGKLQRVSVGIEGRKYNYALYEYADQYGKDYNLEFWKLAPQIIFDFKPRRPNLTSVYKQLRFRMVHVERDGIKWLMRYDYGSGSFKYYPEDRKYVYNIFQLTYSNENRRVLNPYSYKTDFQFDADFARITAELNYRFSYGPGKAGGFDIRVFGGYLHKTSKYEGFSPNLRMAGTDGRNDYMYDGIFVGRTNFNGLWKQQMIVSDGGFYIPTFLGQSSTWLTSVNLRASVPRFSLIRAYFNIGFDQRGYNGPGETLWEAGFILSIIDRKFEVYFPALWSQNIQDVFDISGSNSYGEKIRFTMRLELANPMKILKDIHI